MPCGRARAACRGLDRAAGAACRTISSSTSPRTWRSGANGSSATGSIRRCHGGSPISPTASRATYARSTCSGPLSAAACMLLVWLLGRDIVGGFQALIAVLALEGLHFFNFSVPKFAHDQMQLPFWALTGLFLYRAIARERVLDWLAARRRARALLLVEIRSLRARRQPRPVHAARPDRAAHLADAGPMADGARVPRGDRAQSLLAGRHRLPAAALCRRARQDGDALVPLRHLPAAVEPRARSDTSRRPSP